MSVSIAKGPTMSMLECVSGLIDCAKKLRGVAEALDAGDLKTQIVDELLRLHEIRESLLLSGGGGGGGGAGRAGHTEAVIARVTAEPQKVLVDGDSKIFTFDADEVTETYDLHVGERAGATSPASGAAPAATTANAAVSRGSNGGGKSASGAVAEKTPTSDKAQNRPKGGDSETEIVRASETATLPATAPAAPESAEALSEQQRFALAEQRILELEPLHQAALRKMNDILTDDQRRLKTEATRAGMKAGRKGRELQQSVMAALQLTGDQQQRMAAARKELLDVRQAIGRQVEGLLSKEQLEQMLQAFAKKHGG